ncbi:MFS family permease [Ewingella americana]
MQQANNRRLNRQDFKTLSLAALGGALEFYDFIIFVFFAAVIGDLFFPADMPDWVRQVQTFGIFAAGYLARPLGGVIMAHFGDLIGRKRMFSFSILLMALPTLAMGLLPTYSSIGIAAPLLLLLMRLLQGAAVGGEVPGAWVFVAEHVPRKHIGFACGTLTAGLTVGILLGSLVATVLHSTLSAEAVRDYGWRIPFFIGGIFGLIAMYLRRWLQETPIFLEMKAKKTLAEELPLKSVVVNHKKEIVISMLMTWLLSACLVVVILMTPTYLQKQFAIPAAEALQANSMATIALTFGCIVAGWIIDRIGASKMFIFGSLFLGGCTWAFYHVVATDPSKLMVMYALAGFSVGLVGTVPYVMVRAFPAEVRFTGISFSYNVSYAIFGGLTPIFISFITHVTPMAPAYYILAMAVVGVLMGFYLTRDLNSDEKSEFTRPAASGR